jgi:hypothetical protein
MFFPPKLCGLHYISCRDVDIYNNLYRTAWVSQVDIKRSPTCKLTCFQGQHEIKRQPTQVVYGRLCLKTLDIDVQTGGKMSALFIRSIYIALEMSPISELFQYLLDEITDGVQYGKPFCFFVF